MPLTRFRCIAYIPSRRHAHLWMRCRRLSQRDDRFCRAHRDSFDGLILGLHQWDQRLHGAAKENDAYAYIAEKTPACEACAARRRWKHSRKGKRRLSLPAKKEMPALAQTQETTIKKRRSNPCLPVAPSEAAGNCSPPPHDERSLAPHGGE